jgi:hypothetical protein
MSQRSPSPSLFRPKRTIDQSVLEENRALVQSIDRRKILRGGLSLGALTMLTGCDVTHRDSVQRVLKAYPIGTTAPRRCCSGPTTWRPPTLPTES